MAQRVRMFIRYYASTDDSALGRVALEYLKSLLRIAPVRVLSMSGGMSGPWTYYGSALATPIAPAFVNVVCCEPSRWAWDQTIQMPNRGPDGQVVSYERTSGRAELYTAGVRNVIVIGAWVGPAYWSLARQYQARILPEDVPFSADAGGGAVIPIPVLDHDAVRRVVVP